MKVKKEFLLVICFALFGLKPQKDSAFEVGEMLRFRIHYGIVNAGYATLEVNEATIKSKTVFHVIGKGFSTGVTKLFFEVNDVYESYIDQKTGSPYRFVRKINEGGYIKNQEGFFNSSGDKILVKDYKHTTETVFDIPENTQDILSSFYYLRNYPYIDQLKSGESVAINMFFDNKTTKFKLKFIKREDLNTKFGIVSTMIFRPLVQSGRVFKEEESLTVWISDDQNKVPIRIKADLKVGSIKADLDDFKGLKRPLKIKNKQ